MPTPHQPTSAIRRAMRKLGVDIRDARRRRKLTTTIVAERAFTTRKTLKRIEEGDYAVSIGIYASVLQVLGLLDQLARVADPSNDELGRTLASSDLPQRIRAKKS